MHFVPKTVILLSIPDMMAERRFLESKDISLLIPKAFLMPFTYNQAANITDREGALEAFKGASSTRRRKFPYHQTTVFDSYLA
jgi:hypothetical protein